MRPTTDHVQQTHDWQVSSEIVISGMRSSEELGGRQTLFLGTDFALLLWQSYSFILADASGSSGGGGCSTVCQDAEDRWGSAQRPRRGYLALAWHAPMDGNRCLHGFSFCEDESEECHSVTEASFNKKVQDNLIAPAALQHAGSQLR